MAWEQDVESWKATGKSMYHRNSILFHLKSSGENGGIQAMSRGSAAVMELLQLSSCSGNFGYRLSWCSPTCPPYSTMQTPLTWTYTEAENWSGACQCVIYSQSGWSWRNPKITQTKINLILRPCLDYEKMGSVPRCQGWRGCGQLGTFDHVYGWTAQNWNHFAEPVLAENVLTLAVALLCRQCQPAKYEKWGFVKLLVISCSKLDCSWMEKPQHSHDKHMA